MALLATALAFAWQALTVRCNYGGNWTALFCAGGKLGNPPALAWEGIYKFPNSAGYDGQFYHYQAHDPFMRKGLAQYMDAPRLRYRRILVPLAAFLLAGGQDRFVDTAFFGIIWLSVFLGAYWLSRCVSACGWRSAWGLAFLVVPATIVSLDRMTIDITLAALTLGFILYAWEGPSWKVYLLLGGAVLTRETGVLLTAGYCLYLLWKRLPLKALVFATSAVPALAWAAYLQLHTYGDITDQLATHSKRHQVWPRMFRMPEYNLPPLPAVALSALDYLLAAGALLAIVLAIRFALKQPRTPEAFAALAYALFMLVSVVLIPLRDPYTYARLASPLLLLVGLQGLRQGRLAGWLPLVLVTARTGAQLGPQALGVLRGLLGK
jgi:hypothetical protein